VGIADKRGLHKAEMRRPIHSLSALVGESQWRQRSIFGAGVKIDQSNDAQNQQA
jgi:hypothetical protein